MACLDIAVISKIKDFRFIYKEQKKQKPQRWSLRSSKFKISYSINALFILALCFLFKNVILNDLQGINTKIISVSNFSIKISPLVLSKSFDRSMKTATAKFLSPEHLVIAS